MMIDIYAHIRPKKFQDYASVKFGKSFSTGPPTLWDIEKRLEIMDKYEDYVQVLVPSGPAVEAHCSPEDAANLASLYNDGMAELVDKYPHKFVAAVACIPLNNIEAALKEIDRAINALGFKGIYLNTPVYRFKNRVETGFDHGTVMSLDSHEFMPIYEYISGHDLPIWIHPHGQGGVPVYEGEERGKYALFDVIGWPLESAMAMARLVCSGIMTRFPNLRFITHHCGSGIIPVLSGRLDNSFDKYKVAGMKWGQPDGNDPFDKRPLTDHFRVFYADTALYGDVPGLMCGLAFFGTDHMLFGTDFPWDVEMGNRYIRQTINAVKSMDISEVDRAKIFEGNARRLLSLDAKGQK